MSRDELDLRAATGFIEPRLEEEFPGLRLEWVSVPLTPGRGKSPPGVKQRLIRLSSRFRGANIIGMRSEPVPHAYRSFFRQIGVDPDTEYIPIEKAAYRRLFHGGFKSEGLVQDALLIAVVETGVPVWALDADRVAAGGPGIRTAVDGERVGKSELGDQLTAGRLVVADQETVYGPLFGDITEEHAVNKSTSRALLFSVAVPGVAGIYVEESMWLAAEIFREATG